MEDENYNLTMFEVCEKLSKSGRTVSRYVKNGLLHPIAVKSKQGTEAYRFTEADVEQCRTILAGEDMTAKTRQDAEDRQDTPSIPPAQKGHPKKKPTADNQTEEKAESEPRPELETKDRTDTPAKTRQGTEDRQDRTVKDEIVELLKETVSTLKDQLGTKDKQLAARDEQINMLIERNREMNILVGTLQSKVLLLDQPSQDRTDTPDADRDNIVSSRVRKTRQPRQDRHASQERQETQKEGIIEIEVKPAVEAPGQPESQEINEEYIQEVMAQPPADVALVEDPAAPAAKKGFFRRLFGAG